VSSKQTEDSLLIVEESEEGFSTWINRPYISSERKEKLGMANILILPREGFRGRSEPVFPVGTSELYQYIIDNSDSSVNIDLCIDEDKYQELALHGALIIVGTIIFSSIIGPVIATLISDYIRKRFSSIGSKPEIKVEFTVIQNNGNASRLLYEGPLSAFEETIKPPLLSLAESTSTERSKS